MTDRAMDTPAALGGLRRAVRRVTRLLHTIIGAPDYERYVAHTRACHPGSEPLSHDDFVRERLNARYERPGSRCC